MIAATKKDIKNMKFNNVYKIYKPNKDYNKGCATSWEYSQTANCVFIICAKQKEKKNDNNNPVFDWENSEKMKLEIVDLSRMCLVLNGTQDSIGYSKDSEKGAGLYHKSKDGFAVLKMYKYNNNVALEINSKKKDRQFWSGHLLSADESYALNRIFDTCIAKMYLNSNQDA